MEREGAASGVRGVGLFLLGAEDGEGGGGGQDEGDAGVAARGADAGEDAVEGGDGDAAVVEEVLEALGASDDVEKSKASRQIRSGKGKMRNRRYVQRRGPLVVYSEDSGIKQAFRNIPGVEVCDVTKLNLLQLAPGGHLGRFVVFTEAALSKLDGLYGGKNGAVSTEKKGYRVPRSMMTNSDITRVINSDEVQAKVRPAKKSVTAAQTKRIKKNPLKNLGTMIKLNPYAKTTRNAGQAASRKKSTKEIGRAHV